MQTYPRIKRITGWNRQMLNDKPTGERRSDPVFEGVLLDGSHCMLSVRMPRQGGVATIMSGSFDSILRMLPFDVEVIFHDGGEEYTTYLVHVIDLAERLRDKHGGKIEYIRDERTDEIQIIAWIEDGGPIRTLFNRSVRS